MSTAINSSRFYPYTCAWLDGLSSCYRPWTISERLSLYCTSLIKKKKKERYIVTILTTQLSVLGWGSFCANDCNYAALRGGHQSVTLFRCCGSPGCSDDVLSSALPGLVPLNSPFMIYSLCASGQVSYICVENKTNIKLLSRRKHAVLTLDLLKQTETKPSLEALFWRSSRWYSQHFHSSSRLWALEFLFVLIPGETPLMLSLITSRTVNALVSRSCISSTPGDPLCCLCTVSISSFS